jgi:hypothetical protein
VYLEILQSINSMNATNKKKLKAAKTLIEEAENLISDVKSHYYDGRDRNDEYYGLEQVEVDISSAKDLLDGFTD